MQISGEALKGNKMSLVIFGLIVCLVISAVVQLSKLMVDWMYEDEYKNYHP